MKPLPEVNYKHKGRHVVEQELPGNKKRSAPSRSEITENDHEHPRKKSRLEIASSGSSRRSPTSTTGKRKDPVSYAEAHIIRSDLTQRLQVITARGRPANVIKLNVVTIVGGRRFNPYGEGVDGVMATGAVQRNKSDSSSFDYSQIELSDVLPMHMEFLRSVGVTATEELMSLTTLVPLGAKLLTYR